MTTTDGRIPTALIVSGGTVAAWQASALKHNSDLLDVRCVLIADDGTQRRPNVRHLAYQLLRTRVLRSVEERDVPLDEAVDPRTPRIPFNPIREGAWRRFPPELREQADHFGAVVAIRFGMGLIRDPDSLGMEHGVLSFHHGDPARFRGRPAGFYELHEGESVVGTIVQRLSNDLDAGRILAIGWNRTVRHSYRRTMDGAYRDSRHVLRAALRSLRNGSRIEYPTNGRITRLPTNRVAARFVVDRAVAGIRHLLYGAFVRKAWTVGAAMRTDLALPGEHTLTIETEIPRPGDARFIADPISTPEGDILLEELDRRSGLGVIRRLGRDGTNTRVTLPGIGGHVSYPFTFRHLGIEYLLPEMAQCGPQSIFALNASGHAAGRPLLGLEDYRLIDPTLHHDGTTWWLFAGQSGSEFDLLWLWFADDPLGPFFPHPANPVVHDARRARPAGRLIATPTGLMRPAQDGTGRYGDGMIINRITRLDRWEYEEEPISTVRLAAARGPHTIALVDDRIIVDAYRDRLSPFAARDRIRHHRAGRMLASRR